MESAIARVIGEGKVRTYEKHVLSPRRHGLAVARGGKNSTIEVAKATADYTSS